MNGYNNPILNNLVIDCPIGLHIDSRGMTWPHWNNPNEAGWQLDAKAQAMNYRNPPWSKCYPRLAAIMDDSPREPLYNPIRRNVFVDCTQQVCSFDGNVKKLIDKLAWGRCKIEMCGTTSRKRVGYLAIAIFGSMLNRLIVKKLNEFTIEKQGEVVMDINTANHPGDVAATLILPIKYAGVLWATRRAYQHDKRLKTEITELLYELYAVCGWTINWP